MLWGRWPGHSRPGWSQAATRRPVPGRSARYSSLAAWPRRSCCRRRRGSSRPTWCWPTCRWHGWPSRPGVACSAAPSHGPPPVLDSEPNRPERDPYPDALRACALLVVVLGHWVATLPRLVDAQLVGTAHLLAIWDAAGFLTWLVQVVPLFVFVSAAVSADGVARRMDGGGQKQWWAARALGLARPTVTYLAVLVALARSEEH